MGKYSVYLLLPYLAQSRVSLCLHDSFPTRTSVLASHNHTHPTILHTQRNRSLFASRISPASVHSLHVRPPIHQSPYPPLPSACRVPYVSKTDSSPPSIAIILVWPHRITHIRNILRYSCRLCARINSRESTSCIHGLNSQTYYISRHIQLTSASWIPFQQRLGRFYAPRKTDPPSPWTEA
jgi:hypothetical protein